MSLSVETLAAARKYTDETVLGGGAIKGKNCTMAPAEPITGGNRLTFEWTLDDGTEQSQYIDVMNGAGASIAGTETVDNYTKATYQLQTGKYVNMQGKIGSYDEAVAVEMDVTAGEVYRISGGIRLSSSLYAFVNSGGTVMSVFPNIANLAPLTIYNEVVEIPSGCVKLRACSLAEDILIEKKVGTKIIVAQDHSDDVLWGKKWCFCGDSFTAGLVSKNNKQNATDPIYGIGKTYPWWIGKRHNMVLQNMALEGAKFANIGSGVHFSVADDSVAYNKIASDCDYITLAFGGNDGNLTSEQIGTNTDSTNTTMWGAYNLVLEAILTANPDVKIGIIIQDCTIYADVYNALKAIAQYWRIPVLDLKKDVNVPGGLDWTSFATSSVAAELRKSVFKVSADNNHPTDLAHQYRSTFIEEFLKRL